MVSNINLNCVRKLFMSNFVSVSHRSLNISSRRLNQLTLGNLNPNIKELQYAVRGPLVIRAVALEKELQQGAKKPFKDVIKANIGDAHAMGAQPITFIRQVLALVSYPPLLDDDRFPEDAKQRAKRILSSCGGGSVGAYTMSDGIETIRKDIAAFITERDGVPSNPDTILLSGGASEIIRHLLKLFISHTSEKTGIMIPIPQYPLYSATIVEYGHNIVGYYLDEDDKWSLGLKELKRSITEARDKGVIPKVLVVINPGNPTGQVLSRENIEGIIKFADRENLYLFADEVYQENVYDPSCKFHSFKKVMTEMGPPYDKMELASFYSVSKGYMGECGLRGGYAEIVNMDPDVMAMCKKALSAKLCSTVLGQIVMDTVVNHPKPGEPSYEQFAKEKQERLASLALRAKMVHEALNAMDGITCNPVQGAMYAFPRLYLPKKAIKAAKEVGQEPDFYFAMQLLENAGICIVPGSGFRQKDGTYHFRTTILPQPEKLKEMLERFKAFHVEFMASHS